MLESLIKSTDEFLALKKEYISGNFPSSLLLISKDSLFATEFCLQLAQLIFDGSACGRCENCLKVSAGAHPDLKIYPQKDKLVVAESQEIVMESFVKPIFAKSKVFVIKDIDLAADVAQNKLLKILEEPPKNVYFLLTCSNFEKVLPTIRSRCNKTQLPHVDDRTVEGFLGDIDFSAKSDILAVCDGQIGLALSLCKKPHFEQLCKDCVGVFTKMKSSKQVLSFSNKLSSYKDDFLLVLNVLAIVCGDLIKLKAGQKDLVKFQNFLNEFELVADEYTLRALCEISSLLDRVQKERSFSVNQVLAIENFLLNLLEVKYLCK